MSQITHGCQLPVPIKIEGESYSNVTLHALTISDSYEAVASAGEGQMISLIELAAMCEPDGLDRRLTYAELAASSNQNAKALFAAREELEKKERGQLSESA